MNEFIKIKSLKKYYDNKCVLSIEELNIKKGEIFGLIGKSGAGKTTLMRCLLGIESIDEGDIKLHGISVSEKNKPHLNKVGVIFQSVNLLFTKTVYENIILPIKIQKRKVDEEFINNLLKDVGLYDKKNEYPSSLSGGQRQRVAIARALSTNADILLCDEFTSALDPETTENILNLLLSLSKSRNISIFLITHDMKVIEKISDTVAVMDSGKIVECKCAEDIFINPKSETTVRFLKSDSEPPSYIKNDLKETPEDCHKILINLNFPANSADKPILSIAMKKFDIPLNIIGGNLKSLKNTTIGILWVTIPIEYKNVEEFVSFLNENGVSHKISGYI